MWLMILGIVALIAVVMFFNGYQNKYQSFQGKIFNFFLISLMLFLIVTVGYVFVNSGTKIQSLGDVFSFVKLYFSWVGGAFSNSKSIVGYAVQQDWGMNSTVGG